MSRDVSQFGAETTAEEVLEDLDLGGKTILITGASSGLGAQSARALAGRGATLVLTARQLAKVEGVAAEIRESSGNANVSVMRLELTDWPGVRRFAADFVAAHPKLDILINNAGVMGCPLTRTADAIEMQFASNHLGHFLLTNGLRPALEAAAPSRIVAVSSAGHRISPVLFDDPGFERTAYDKWIAYGQSKTANVLHAVALDARLQERGVRAFAIHPGAIMTELGRHLKAEDLDLLNAMSPSGAMEFKSVGAGAATQVFAATAPELDGRGGVYLEDCHVADVNPGDGMEGVRPYAIDPANAERLWKLSESLLS